MPIKMRQGIIEQAVLEAKNLLAPAAAINRAFV